MKIAFFNLDDNEKKIININFINSQLKFFNNSINQTDIGEFCDSEIICICPKSNVNKMILDKCKNLKYVITRSTGIDHIDSEYCKVKNINIKNTTKYGGITVAEYQFALILNLIRKIKKAEERVENKSFLKNNLQGFELYGKTIGVIGCGNIGKNIVRIANGFGMNVLVYTRTIDNELSKKMNFKYVSLDELYSESDIVSVNVPLTGETYHLINESAFNKMKKDVIFINTSRGKIVNTEDLISAIENNKIGGAALDVLEGEKFLKGDFLDINNNQKERVVENLEKLLSFENVIITPHNAYNTKEAVDRIIDETIENIKSCFK